MATRVSLSAALPKPKYTGEGEDPKLNGDQSTAPRAVGPEAIQSTQVVLKREGPPPYGQRKGWRPRGAEDFGDGGAFPEIPFAQYPLGMGQKQQSSSNALTVQVDSQGKVDYGAIARRGHNDKRIIHSEFKDLIPLRQRADAGDISLDRPSTEDAEATRERTQKALDKLINGAVAAQKPKNSVNTTRAAPTYVSYTPSNQMGEDHQNKTRIIKIVEKQKDPMEPPKFKAKKIPRGPPSPPPPVMHSPPRKLTAEDQEMWRIPPPVSNWKNPKGYTVPLDKRLAADGRGLQDVTINDKFAQITDALATADRHAREEVRQRAIMRQRLAEQEKAEKEEHLRTLAQNAREEAAAARSGGGGGGGGRRRRGSSASSRSSRSSSASGSNSEQEALREREAARRSRREEDKRQMRQSRMGTERRLQAFAREQDRDISEKVALGLAKPTAQGEAMYDSRLFNRSGGGLGQPEFNEDQHYDRPLFAAQEAVQSIYRPGANVGADEEDGEDGGQTMERIQKASRFEVLGRAGKGFKGSEVAERKEGPVQFERDSGRGPPGEENESAKHTGSGTKEEDPFGIDQMISEATGGRYGGSSKAQGDGGSKKRYGMQEADSRSSKRARVDDDSD